MYTKLVWYYLDVKRNVTISIDEKTLEAARKYAALHGKSFQELVRESIERTIQQGHPRSKRWSFLERVERVQANSGGWKWNREEIYEHIYKDIP